MADFDANSFVVTATVVGNVSAATLTNPTFVFPFDVELIGVGVSCGTAPATTSIIVNVALDGTNAYSTGSGVRPEVAATKTTAYKGNPDTKSTLTAGKVAAVVFSQVGTGTTGADVTVALEFRRR